MMIVGTRMGFFSPLLIPGENTLLLNCLGISNGIIELQLCYWEYLDGPNNIFQGQWWQKLLPGWIIINDQIIREEIWNRLRYLMLVEKSKHTYFLSGWRDFWGGRTEQASRNPFLDSVSVSCSYGLQNGPPLHQTGEGNGTPLQYSCLENPMDGGAW